MPRKDCLKNSVSNIKLKIYFRNSNITIQSVVPDTITSWVLTGFSISNENGLALSKQPTNVKVFMPFFMTLNLPYSVKRGEILAIQVLVFNYMDSAVVAEVTLDNSAEEFSFVNVMGIFGMECKF